MVSTVKMPEPWTMPTVHNPPNPRDWSIKEVRDLVEQKLGKRPCWIQILAAKALRAGKDLVVCARTGAGKTMSFWIALLLDMEEGGRRMIFVVAPLNSLGKQNAPILSQIEAAGLTSIAVSAENANPKTFKRHLDTPTKSVWAQDIAEGKYRVVTINPEILMTHPEVRKMWKTPAVTSKIQYFVFDEGHCISQWASFREQYSKLGDLRYLIPEDVPFYVASATLPQATLNEVVNALHLRAGQGTEYIMRSNDRPEISLMVRGMVHPAKSWKDLDFLVPDGYSASDVPLPKFLVFFDNIKEAEKAWEHLVKRLPASLHHRISYFHATLTPKQREDEIEAMSSGEKWGMGMDISGIEIVVQWRAPSNLSTLWQRFGRAARSEGQQGVAILIVAGQDLHENRLRKAENAKKKKNSAKEGIGTKRKNAPAPSNNTHPNKRPAFTAANAAQPTTAGNLPQDVDIDADVSDADAEGEDDDEDENDDEDDPNQSSSVVVVVEAVFIEADSKADP
ncbi:hypothetical protein D9619_000013 [Psilocybe cf. subviscida]|uniref:DNA 3'-5' helicase n=1 Tax=Psilocybe cf. subviscida TaxID=2480587 RepID=A0A8H5F3X0_9AGAR|nr:hypothetical protein D9619_000013 [Psilocybe cf. subviscida]